MFAQKYPDIEIIRQVMDNPNTHKEKLFYEAGSVRGNGKDSAQDRIPLCQNTQVIRVLAMIDQEKCTQCGTCIEVCPGNAISKL
jgi:ferredoxin